MGIVSKNRHNLLLHKPYYGDMAPLTVYACTAEGTHGLTMSRRDHDFFIVYGSGPDARFYIINPSMVLEQELTFDELCSLILSRISVKDLYVVRPLDTVWYMMGFGDVETEDGRNAYIDSSFKLNFRMVTGE